MNKKEINREYNEVITHAESMRDLLMPESMPCGRLRPAAEKLLGDKLLLDRLIAEIASRKATHYRKKVVVQAISVNCGPQDSFFIYAFGKRYAQNKHAGGKSDDRHGSAKNDIDMDIPGLGIGSKFKFRLKFSKKIEAEALTKSSMVMLFINTNGEYIHKLNKFLDEARTVFNNFAVYFLVALDMPLFVSDYDKEKIRGDIEGHLKAREFELFNMVYFCTQADTYAKELAVAIKDDSRFSKAISISACRALKNYTKLESVSKVCGYIAANNFIAGNASFFNIATDDYHVLKPAEFSKVLLKLHETADFAGLKLQLLNCLNNYESIQQRIIGFEKQKALRIVNNINKKRLNLFVVALERMSASIRQIGIVKNKFELIINAMNDESKKISKIETIDIRENEKIKTAVNGLIDIYVKNLNTIIGGNLFDWEAPDGGIERMEYIYSNKANAIYEEQKRLNREIERINAVITREVQGAYNINGTVQRIFKSKLSDFLMRVNMSIRDINKNILTELSDSVQPFAKVYDAYGIHGLKMPDPDHGAENQIAPEKTHSPERFSLGLEYQGGGFLIIPNIKRITSTQKEEIKSNVFAHFQGLFNGLVHDDEIFLSSYVHKICTKVFCDINEYIEYLNSLLRDLDNDKDKTEEHIRCSKH